MSTATNPAYDPNNDQDLWNQVNNPTTFKPGPPPNYGKAIAIATAPTDQGYADFLPYEVRKSLVDTKMCSLARFLESLYFVGFKSGPITAKQAAKLILHLQPLRTIQIATTGNNQFESRPPKEETVHKHCLKMLEELAALRDRLASRIDPFTENLFPQMPIANNEKVSHRPEKVYYVPAAFVLNDLLAGPNPTYIAIPVRALKSNVVYKAFVWKKPIIEQGKVTGKQVDLCKEMPMSRATMRKYAFISGVKITPAYVQRKLYMLEKRRLPKNRKEQNQSKQRFNRVWDSSGATAYANLEDIARKGLNSSLGLGGTLYCNKRIGSRFVDEMVEAWTTQPPAQLQAEMPLDMGQEGTFSQKLPPNNIVAENAKNPPPVNRKGTKHAPTNNKNGP